MKSKWADKMGKSIPKLVDSRRNLEEFELNQTDIVIMPDTNFTSEIISTYPRTMTIRELLDFSKKIDTLILYPSTYIEYEDYRGQKYDAIRLNYIVLDVNFSNGFFKINPLHGGIEKYAWDIHFKQD